MGRSELGNQHKVHCRSQLSQESRFTGEQQQQQQGKTGI